MPLVFKDINLAAFGCPGACLVIEDILDKND
jgi:hypothetical protein